MTYTATIVVASDDHEATTQAVREADTSLGAREFDLSATRTNATRIVGVSRARDVDATGAARTLFARPPLAVWLEGERTAAHLTVARQ